MISRNKEHSELVHMAGPAVPVMLAVGMDPVRDIEKLNIDYDLYDKGAYQLEAVYREVRGATDVLARLRDEVGAKWTGSAADQFDRYAEKVVVAGAAERGLIDAQDKATTQFFEEIKTKVQAANDAIMKVVTTGTAIVNPVGSLAVGIARMVNDTADFPEYAIPTDLFALAEEALKAIGAIVDLPKKFGEAKFDSTIGSLALNDVADFWIAPGQSEGAIPTGLEGNEKNSDAWKER